MMPWHVVWEAWFDCTFMDPGMYREGPYFKSMKWCDTVNRAPYVILMNHMYVHAAKMDAAFAAQFGSNVKLAYFPDIELFMFNPRIINHSYTQFGCAVDLSNTLKPNAWLPFLPVAPEEPRHEWVTVNYIDAQFKYAERTFTDDKSCLVQVMLEQM